jgi:hypothetical protein
MIGVYSVWNWAEVSEAVGLGIRPRRGRSSVTIIGDLQTYPEGFT